MKRGRGRSAKEQFKKKQKPYVEDDESESDSPIESPTNKPSNVTILQGDLDPDEFIKRYGNKIILDDDEEEIPVEPFKLNKGMVESVENLFKKHLDAVIEKTVSKTLDVVREAKSHENPSLDDEKGFTGESDSSTDESDSSTDESDSKKYTNRTDKVDQIVNVNGYNITAKFDPYTINKNMWNVYKAAVFHLNTGNTETIMEGFGIFDDERKENYYGVDLRTEFTPNDYIFGSLTFDRHLLDEFNNNFAICLMKFDNEIWKCYECGCGVEDECGNGTSCSYDEACCECTCGSCGSKKIYPGIEHC